MSVASSSSSKVTEVADSASALAKLEITPTETKPENTLPPVTATQVPSSVASSSSSKTVSVASSSKEESKVTEVSDSASALAKLEITPTETKPENTLPPASSKAVTLRLRPGFGRVGRKITVRANHFLVQVADRDLYHYDVSINPEVISKKVNRDVMKNLVDTYKNSHLAGKIPAYDGRKSLYTAGALPFESKEFVVNLADKRADGSFGKERQFKVAIKLASRPDLYQLQEFLRRKQRDVPYDTIQVLDVVLRDTPSQVYVSVGRSFFDPSLGRKGDLGNGIEYWRGYFQSLRLTQMGLSLNIDISARSFYEEILVTDFISKYLNISDFNRPLNDAARVKVKKALKTLKVTLVHWNHAKSAKISGISNCPISQLRFKLEDNSEKTVIQYFAEKYNHRVKYPSLPAGALPFESKEFVVNLADKRADGSFGKERRFKVAIKLASRPDLYQLQEFLRRKQRDVPYDTIQVLDVVLRDTPSQVYVSVGRSFFDPSLGRKGDLGNGIEYWRGYFQSLRLTQMGLSLNIDISARSFYEEILVTDFISKYLNISDFNRPLNDAARVKVKKALKTLKVTLVHWNHAKSAKISGISNCPISQLRFKLEDNSEKTVIQYFAEKYNHRVKYPSLPAGALPFESKEFVVNLADKRADGSFGKERRFKVAIKLASRPDLYQLQEFLRRKQRDVPYDTIQVLDVVLRDTPSQVYVSVGRSFFDPSLGRKGDLGNGIEYWRGYFQSLRLTQMGLSLNIAVLFLQLCRIAERQRYTKKLNERQVTALLRATCQRPQERENAIKEMVVKNNYNGLDLVSKEFGMSVTAQLASVEARVLPPPMLKYHESGKEKMVNPSVGQWNMINKLRGGGGKRKRNEDVPETEYDRIKRLDREFKARLRGQGFEIRKMEKDGNCFYTAIADQLEGKQPETLRKDIVKYMLANPATFSEMVEIEDRKDLRTYCKRMKKVGEWAGHPELVAAARVLRRDIEVYSATSLEPQRFSAVENQSTERIIRLSYHKGNHYNSLIVQQKDPEEEQKEQKEEQKDPDSYAKIDKIRGKRPSKFFWDNENTPVPRDFPAGKSVYQCIQKSMKKRGFTGPLDIEIVVGYTDTVVKRVGKEIPIIYASQTKRPPGSANNQIADNKIEDMVDDWLKDDPPPPPQNVIIMSSDTGFKEMFDSLVEAGHTVILISLEQENQNSSAALKEIASFSYNLRTIFGLPETPPETRKKRRRKALKMKKKALKMKKQKKALKKKEKEA